MKIMIIGLGLIGGSLALALRNNPERELYAVERDEWSRFEALNRGAVRAAWESADDAPLEHMDLLVICLHPQASADFVLRYHDRFRPGLLVTDVCGVKKPLRDAFRSLGQVPFTYLGGHPMAGKEKGGFANASEDLFRGCHYILTPDETTPPQALQTMRTLVSAAGAADVILTDPESHDERIAYTSQLMHVLALALCDGHLLFDSYGFEGGSFRGATRVAALDPNLWCELFTANRETLADLTDELADNLKEYSAILRRGNREELLIRLISSSDRKKAFDRLKHVDQTRTELFR